MNNIILIGFMGSGKSSVAKKLKHLSKFELIDTDQTISNTEKRSISRIFEESGEASFRNLETTLCKSLIKSSNTIISTGGGIIENRETQSNLRSCGTVYFLETSIDTVLKRLRFNRTRPLLRVKNKREVITDLLQKRTPLYRKTAHVTIQTDHKTQKEIAAEIWHNFNQRSNSGTIDPS